MEKQRLFVSFSGGKSSAFMAWMLHTMYGHIYDIIFVFANTGQELEKTLIFVKECAERWGVFIVWVEAVTHHGKRIGCTHRVVTYETASRRGEPFEDMIKKYGIPNHAYPHCTRELKMNPMYSYINSIWEKGTYKIALGIRADEPNRIRKDADKANIIYPMVSMFPSDKIDVNDWWEDQPFNLGIKEHQGNCSWCWKKSQKKHFALIRETPDVFDFPRAMEAAYGLSGYNEDGAYRVFFRGHKSTDDLFNEASQIGTFDFREYPDENGGCAESCDINDEIECA